jgi:hypothetical protein
VSAGMKGVFLLREITIVADVIVFFRKIVKVKDCEGVFYDD